MSRHLKLRIEIDVTGADGAYASGMIHSAMLELVNRVEFRNGTIKQGRAVTIMEHSDDMICTVDILRLNHHETSNTTDGCADQSNRSQNP